jgi:glycosyltransferase involved in cell wall biosynthesis
MTTEPTASVIISAYNRPRVIPFAIRSVIHSDCEDWELIVVGDGCNAETEEAVRSFDDPRIRFFNLPANSGHQSAPHNKGVELARGEFVMFLNQDDMYFPDHISQRVAHMRATGADVSWSPIVLLQHSGLDHGPVDFDRDRLTLDGTVANGQYDPRSFIISSSWALRREACSLVGPWLSPKDTRLSPSQEWLFRAYRQGRHMSYHSYPSVLCIHSGVRRYSFIKAESPEHERAWTWVSGGDAERLKIFTCVAVQRAAELNAAVRTLEKARRPLRYRVERALLRRGVHPHSVQRFLAGLAKGDWVGNHKRITEKPPELRLGQSLPFGEVIAEDFLGDGWHPAEANGRWSTGRIADLFFTVPPSQANAGPVVLELCGHALRNDETVTFRLSPGNEVEKAAARNDEVTVLQLPGPGSFHLSVSVTDPASPQSLGMGPDNRVVGYWLGWLRLAPAK